MTRLHSRHFAKEARPITALLEARADIDHPDRMLIDQNGRSLTFGKVAEFTATVPVGCKQQVCPEVTS